MQYLTHLAKSLARNAALASIVLTGAAFSLRADRTCIGDCTPASHLSGISGIEDLEAGASGFDIYFKPGLPIFFSSDSSNKKNSGSSEDSYVFGSWGDAGSLQFDSGGGSQGSGDNSPGHGDNKDSSLTQLFNSPGPGIHCDPPPTDPAPTPEPRYSGLAMLGLGWALFGAYRLVRSRRGHLSAS